MLISLTVGKVDAGVAVLLTEDKRLIEFPSILLPPSISSGSIVDINVSRNIASETAAQSTFSKLQNTILSTYGQSSPTPPTIRCRNATQTSVVLEWDSIELATADLRSLALYKNGQKMGNIPRPRELTSTKLSGLAIDTEFTFHLVLRTSAGTYSSEKLTVKTHKMTDLSGITVTPGVLPAPLRTSLESAIERVGAKMSETVRIDTTHFLTTEGRGREWERAVEMNIPVVRPEWLEGCEREGRIVGVRGYYLNADPKLRQVGQGVGIGSGQQQQQSRPSQSQTSTPRPTQPGTPGQSAQKSEDRPDSSGQPPALPEKDRPGISRSMTGQSAREKIASPQASPNPTSDQEESDDNDEDDEEGSEADVARASAQGSALPVRTAEKDDDAEEKEEEDDGSFSEVKL